ncbi:cobalt ECF transporter T component CbiQ [Velocimicrobium porci]|uniref:Cobalt ECF transporter T component CbiQ n=1 Tax=Velocimicrobium porci TaxID=2606634 RepID=A0A6L5XV67_9FIRM|nr:cobalt ECF transporter T component CbiQ [Velocimicrobium porci]MSS62499.1 cobalt ECF transporter T component CbiQ [Velocimicrobium porci]
MILIDKLCYTSKLRYTNPMIKFLFAIITLILCVAVRSSVIACIVLITTAFLTIQKGGISPSHYIHFMKLPLIFLVLSTIAIVFNISPTPFSAFAIPFFHQYITLSRASLLSAVQLILTALASVSCLYFLSLSTPITDILYVLQRLHCPELLIELMLLIYRFIFVLLEISNSLYISQQSRLGNVDFKTSCKSAGALMSTLLVRAFKKSSFLYDAMESRCYDGTIHVLQETYPVNKLHILYFVLFELTLIGLSVYLGR